MNFYLLTRIKNINILDQYNSFLIIAPNEETARMLATEKDDDIWLKPKFTHCELLDIKNYTEPEIIVADFAAA